MKASVDNCMNHSKPTSPITCQPTTKPPTDNYDTEIREKLKTKDGKLMNDEAGGNCASDDTADNNDAMIEDTVQGAATDQSKNEKAMAVIDQLDENKIR